MFAHRVPLFNKIILPCSGVWPSHTTNAEPISTVVTSVEAPYYALRPPLPASKIVLSSWRLVVMCALIARGKFKPELEFHARTSCSYHALCRVREYRVCRSTGGSPLFNSRGSPVQYAEFGTKGRSLSVSNGRRCSGACEKIVVVVVVVVVVEKMTKKIGGKATPPPIKRVLKAGYWTIYWTYLFTVYTTTINVCTPYYY